MFFFVLHPSSPMMIQRMKGKVDCQIAVKQLYHFPSKMVLHQDVICSFGVTVVETVAYHYWSEILHASLLVDCFDRRVALELSWVRYPTTIVWR